MKSFFASLLLVACGLLFAHSSHAQQTSCLVGGGKIFILGGKAICFPTGGAVGNCPVTVGSLTLTVTESRSTGISPLMVWYDATATTDSAITGNNTVVQDVNFAWTFGDSGSSGTGKWAFGGNPGQNSKNTDIGIIAAHMYMVADGAGDTTYAPQVVATDGTNNATCNPPTVTAFDPVGSNGFTNANTTCYFNSTVGSGCPSGATQTTSSTIVAGNLTGLRKLYKCGDVFTSTGVSMSGTKGQLGAYGGCQGTTTNQPIFRATTIVDGLVTPSNPSTDMRITDIAFDGNCSGGGQSGSLACSSSSGTILFDNQNGGNIGTGNMLNQYTLYNVKGFNHFRSFQFNAGTQMAIISSNVGAMWNGCGFNCINLHWNNGGVGFGTGTAGGCTPSTCNWTNVGNHEAYGAIMGNTMTNGASGNNTAEVIRVGYMLEYVLSHNSLFNAGGAFAILKLHNLSFNNNVSNGGTGAFNGTYYTQYNEISDNYMSGSSGAQCQELSPQNNTSDERIRWTVMERNVYNCTANGFTNGRSAWLSTTNSTFRNNAILAANGTNCCMGLILTQLGIEPVPQFNEVYNNTFNGTGGVQPFVNLNNFGGIGHAGGTNNIVANNLGFNNGGDGVVDSATNNTVNNNTVSTASNPSFTNGSGLFDVITDFKPTANFSGATNVPVWFDALGTAWPPTWDLGAVHH